MTYPASSNDITAFEATDDSATQIRQNVYDSVPNSSLHRGGLGHFSFDNFDTFAELRTDANIQARHVSQAQEAQGGFNVHEAYNQPASVTSSMDNSPSDDITGSEPSGPAIRFILVPFSDAHNENATNPDGIGPGSPIFITPLFHPDIGVQDTYPTVVQYVEVSSRLSVTENRPDIQWRTTTFQSGPAYGAAGDEQRDVGGGRDVGRSDQRLDIPYAGDHSRLEEYEYTETPGSAQLAGMPWLTHSALQKDVLANAGSQSKASPISESRWNNDSITYPTPCPSQNAALPSPTPCTGNPPRDPRRIKKRTADRERNKARETTKRQFKVLFPRCRTSNDALRTAIKVIRYLMANTVIPPNIQVVNEWCNVQGFHLSVPTVVDATTPSASSSNETNGPSDEQGERKARKKAMDKARNAEEQALTKMLVGMFRDSGGDTVVKALDLASDYLAYARQMGKGMLPIASPEWHDAYDKYQQEKSRFFASG